eukprot:43167_1
MTEEKKTESCDDLGYLDFPRIHFHGKFRANVSTINNKNPGATDKSYGDAMIMNYKQFENAKETDFTGGNFNPYGDGAWSFKDCSITGAYGKDGKLDDKTYANFEINPGASNISGRLVDLDPDQQSISRIYGFDINICDKNNNNDILLKSKFDPASFHNMWVRDPVYDGDQRFSGSYVSILKNCEFAEFDNKTYSVLNELKNYAKLNDYKLMIKFITHLYNGDWTNELEFTYGRVYGVIGVYTKYNPIRSLKYGRYLASSYPKIDYGLVGGFAGQFATIKYSKSTNNLYVDLSNYIPTVNGNNVDIGNINIKLNDKTIITIESKQYFKNPPPSVEWRKHGGIYTFMDVSIDEDEYYNNPITIECSKDKINKLNEKYKSRKYELYYISTEGPNGYYAMSEDLQIRLGTQKNNGPYLINDIDNNKEFIVYISQFGKPVTIKEDASTAIYITSSNVSTAPENFDQRLEIKDKLSAHGNKIENGFYKVTVTAPKTLFYIDPNIKITQLPRWYSTYYLDSFVYNLEVIFQFFITDDTKKDESKQLVQNITPHKHPFKFDIISKDEDIKTNDSNSNKANKLMYFVGSVLVFNEIDPNELPAVATWQPDIVTDLDDKTWEDLINYVQPKHPYIRPIFRQYSNLYPIMRRIVNLDGYASVTSKVAALKRAFNAPFDSAHYMPVTRDISPQKLMLINSWLNNPIFCDSLVDTALNKFGYNGLIDNIEQLKLLLQHAIELELSTLPLYLSALYSINPNSDENSDIIHLFRSITEEEMQHMALACNLLTSIGGKPCIASRDVVDRTAFPRNGISKIKSKLFNKEIHVMPDLKLELAPMNTPDTAPKKTKSTIETFMNIERPANFYIDNNTLVIGKQDLIDSTAFINTLTLDKNAKFEGIPITFKQLTQKKNENKDDDDDDDKDDEKKKDNNISVHGIGSFYELIRKGFIYLSNNLKNGENDLFVAHNMEDAMNINKQIGPTDMKGVNYVYNLKSALMSLNTIVSEGEGTSLTDIWGSTSELSHFHKFLEISIGKKILSIGRRKGPETDPNEVPHIYVFANDAKIPFNDKDVVNYKNSPQAWDWLKLENKKKMQTDDNNKDIRVIRFNEDYGKLLLCLQEIFGDGKIEKFGSAISIMRQLQLDFNDCIRPPRAKKLDENDDAKNDNESNDKTKIPKRIAPNWIPPTYIIPV